MSDDSKLAIAVVDGWTLSLGADEPRVRDVDLAERLAYEQPRMIRKLIKRMIDDGEIIDVHCRSTVERQSTGNGGTREFAVSEFWLTEEQALLVAARSSTAAAMEVRRTLVRAFVALRHGRSPTLDAHALAREVANIVIAEVRALPAPAVLAYDREQVDEAIVMTAALAADGSALATLERLFTTADPAKPIGEWGADAIKRVMREHAYAEADCIVPKDAGSAALESKRRSLLSKAYSDLREDVRTGRAKIHKLPAVYRAPILEWLKRDRERIVRAFPNAFQRKLPFDPAAE